MNTAPSVGRFKSMARLLAIPLLVMGLVSIGVHYGLTAYFVSEAEENVRSLLLSHRGFHRYIQEIMHPTFYKARDAKEVSPLFYVPEILSSSFIVRNIHRLQNEERGKSSMHQIYYKMASHNPRNPVNIADPQETELIKRFNDDRNLKTFRRIETIDGKDFLYYATPFLTTTKACLKCHGKREDAPLGLQALYPGEGGFNEHEGEIRAIESIRAPIGQEMSRAMILTSSVSAGFLVMMALLLSSLKMRGIVQERTANLVQEVKERKAREHELEQKNAELERFTYTVSHDLKSPLITIKGFAGSMGKDLANGRHERAIKDLQRIADAADKMGTLLNGLLELSRIGRIMNPPVKVEMNGLIKEVLGQLAGPITQRGVQIIVSDNLPQVAADRPRLLEVWQNLIENAIKYMGEQTSPQIELGVCDRIIDGHQVKVWFARDNGMGIDQRYHETVFGLFNKLDAQSEGTGIGLALVRRIIDFHGGRIWVESEGIGKGSIFCFTLSAQVSGALNDDPHQSPPRS